MLQPVGDLPAAVYWRRRAVVVVTVVSVVALIVWLLTAAASGSNGTTPAAAAGPGAGPGASATADPSRPATAPPPAGWLTPSGSPTGPATEPATTAAPTTSAAPSTSTPPLPSPPPTTPADPQPCGDDVTRVTVAPAAPGYDVDTMPTLVLSVTNTGTAPCTRNLDPARQEILIYDGPTRIWGSNDCYPATAADDVRVLQPAQPVSFEVLWSGLSAEPTCTQPRTRVPAGTYTLRGRLDQLVGPDAAITMR